MAVDQDSLIFPVHFDMDKAIKNAEQAFKDKEKEFSKAFNATVNLKISSKSIENLEDVQKRLKEIRLQPVTPDTRNAIKTLVKELEALAKILEKVDRLNAQSSKQASSASATSALEAQRNARTAQIEAKTADDKIAGEEKLRQAKLRTQKAELDLARAQERATRTTNTQTKAFHSQANMLNGLKQTMGAYISLLGAKTLVNNIREVTAEFELQKVALSAILQDKQKADELFNQVVQLAVKSPFQIKEMVGFTKQLAAYRINTEDLFDTTKRLADVSAGLGVEMSRLILAYGQVSAASVLRGQEVRQFTEAGIPLIQLLAEKFTELNGEMTTTGDVFQLISERAVPFQMVKEVFEDMTNEGGIFYDMQAKQANTLHGIYSNLRDAWDVAFNEIGQENLWLFKRLGQALTDLGENWRTLETSAQIALTAIGTYKIAMMAASIATRKKTSAIMAEIAAERIRLMTLSASTNATKADILANEAMAAQSTKTLYLKTRLANANNILTKSYYRLRLASMATVWGLVAAAIGAAVYAIYRYVNAESDVVRMQRKVSEYAIEQKSAFDSSSNSLDYLMTKLKKASKGSQEYASIIGEINKRYASFLPEQLKVSQSYEQVAISIGKVKKALEEKAKAESYSAGIGSIEADYGGKMKDAYEKAIKSLTTSGFAGYSQFVFSEEQARDLWTTIVDTLKSSEGKSKSEKDVRKLIQDTFNKAVSEKGIDTSKLNMSIENYPQLKGFREGVSDVSSAIRELQINTENFDKVQSATFGSNKAPTFAERLKEIEVYSKSAMESLDSLSFSDKLEYKQEVHKLNIQRLEDIISLYKEFNQFDMVKKYQIELETLKGISKGWSNIIKNMIASREDNSLFFLKPTDEETSIFTYADRLKKSYKELSEQIDALKGSQGKAGLKIDDGGKQLARYERQLQGVIDASRELNIDLSDTPKKTGGKDPRVESLEAELKLIKEVYNKYKELSKSMNETDAMSYISEVYGSMEPAMLKYAFNEDDLRDRYIKFIGEMRKLGVKEEVVQKFILEYKDNEFSKFKSDLEKKLKRLGDDLEKQQKANKFFEKMLGVGMDVQLASSISMNLYGFDSSDIRQTMINQLEEGLGNIELDITPEGTIDFSKVIDRIQANEILSPDTKEAYIDIAKTIRDNDAETISNLYSNLSKYSEYENRRLSILRQSNEERKNILSSAVPESQKAGLLSDTQRKEDKELSKLEYDMFKQSDLYTTMFENLDRVSTSSLNLIMSKLETFKKSGVENLDPTQVKELTKSFERIRVEIVNRDPFKTFTKSINSYITASKKAVDADKKILKINDELVKKQSELNDLLSQRVSAESAGQTTTEIDKQTEAVKKVIEALEKQLNIQINITNEARSAKDALAESASKIGSKLSGIDSSMSDLRDTMEMFGVDMDSQFGATFDDIQKVIGGASDAFTGFGKVVNGDLSGIGDMIKGTGNLVQGFVGVFTGMNRKVAKANREIKKQAEILRVLNEEYRKLDKAIDGALGSDYAKVNIEQVKNIEAQVVATQKQLEAEKSKGKKKDKDRIKEYEQQLVELQEAVVDKQRELTEHMLGTTVGDAARDFASAWLDAYLSFSNTTDAIKDRFKDMLNNLVVEAVLAKAIESRISKLFEDTNGIWTSTGDLNMNALNSILAQVSSLPEDLDKILTAIAGKLDLEKLRVDSESSLTGMSKAVGSLSEDTALVLASAANSSLYYNVGQYNELVIIKDILTRWEAERMASLGLVEQGSGLRGLVSIQSEALQELRKVNTSLDNISQINKEIKDFLVSLSSPIGSKSGTHAINVNI